MTVIAQTPEWVRIAMTTLPKFVKGAEDATFRFRVLLAMLKAEGRVKTNVSGLSMIWDVEFSQAPMQTNNGAQPVTFQGHNYYQRASISWEGYLVQDFITKRERLMNKNTEAILDIYGGQVKKLTKDLTAQFAPEIYVDSTAVGKDGHMSGIETMMGLNGTVQIDSGAQRAANVLDVVGYPSSTYAGISTQLGALGGSWQSQADIDTTWPYGYGDPEYDAFSPTVVNYGSSAWGGTANTWKYNALAATRYGIWAMARNRDSAIPLILYPLGMYREFLDLVSPQERINVENSKLRKLGFGRSIYWDNAEITTEFGIPPGVGYGFDINSMELLSLQSDLFVPDGPTWNQAARGWQTLVDCLGNFKFESPRNFCKWANLKNS